MALSGVLLCTTLAAASRIAVGQLAVDHVEVALAPQPGGQRIGLITVRNEGTKPVQAVLRLEDWDRAEDGNNRWYALGTMPGSCGEMLHLFPLALALDPGASQSVRVQLDSAAAPQRECWAAAVVETAQPHIVSGRSVTYLVRTAVKIYVQPQGLAANGIVTDMRVHPLQSTNHLELVFENAGQRHVLAHGNVEFRRPDNSLAATVNLPDMYVLPGAKSRVAVPIPPLASGRYVALGIVDYGGDEIAAAQMEYEAH
jgi:P pilus assembly chaperone PapD